MTNTLSSDDSLFNSSAERVAMINTQLRKRGISDRRVLAAMNGVPRELFIGEEEREYAYHDSALPISCNQTISQPYIVGLMAEMLELRCTSRILEVGAGSGYAAAVLGQIARKVYAIEWHEELARQARKRIRTINASNVEIIHGDGSRGLAKHAPFDAILVSAAGASVPSALKQQLAIGGCLVIPVEDSSKRQTLRKVRRLSRTRFDEKICGGVRFVPLRQNQEPSSEDTCANDSRKNHNSGSTDSSHSDKHEPTDFRICPKGVAGLISEEALPLSDTHSNLAPLLDQIGDSRIVLIGEATHGTAEFYKMRSEITKRLISEKGFRVVAIEADWPDTKQVDRYVRKLPYIPSEAPPFSRFPRWMWRNDEAMEFAQWLHEFNKLFPPKEEKTCVVGLDLYSLYASTEAVLYYLELVDPTLATIAREHYGCLAPWMDNPSLYGLHVASERAEECEQEVLRVLKELLRKRLEDNISDELFDAIQNARVAVRAEEYYRALYRNNISTWNLRDRHMFETLKAVGEHYGYQTKIVVWAHNSHVGISSATEMKGRGEHNLGELCHNEYGNFAFHIGFGTHTGEVAAARRWGDEVEFMRVRPSLKESYENLCHTSNIDAFMLHLRHPRRQALRDELLNSRLERAIGVIYRPETERISHYFKAKLPEQFDEYIWFNTTSPVHPLSPSRSSQVFDSIRSQNQSLTA